MLLLRSIAGGFITAVLVWALLVLNRERLSEKHLIGIVIGLAALLRIIFVFTIPLFYAPDEQSHYNYVNYLCEHKSLPVQLTKTDNPSNEWEYYQPPLYYAALTPALCLSRSLFKTNIYLILCSLRIISVFLWFISAVMLLKILKLLEQEDIFIKIFTVSMFCLVPTYVYLSSVINNDNMLIMIGTVLLYLLLEKRSFLNSTLLGILLGAAFLTKLTAIVYLILVVIYLCVEWRRYKLTFPLFILHLSVICAISAIMWFPWALRNERLYGEFFAEHIANVPYHWKSILSAAATISNYLQASFWSTFGIHNDITFLPELGIQVVYFALAGLFYGIFGKDRLIFQIFKSNSAVCLLIASAIAVICNIVFVARFGILYGQSQGRFMFPLLIPISLFCAAGIKLLGINKLSGYGHIHAAGFFISYAVLFLAFVTGMLIFFTAL